jgi:uncharacterized membrane protein YoaK (UPF0700 family)
MAEPSMGSPMSSDQPSPAPALPSPPGSVAAVALAGVAGFVDAAGFLTLGGVFTAHMSGNSARLGVRLGQGDLTAALPMVAAIALFVFGVAAGALASELWVRRGRHTTVAVVLAVQAAMLAAFMLYGASVVKANGGVHGHSLTGFYVLLALLVVAMGLQTTSIQKVGGRRLRTTYITGVLTDLAQQALNRVVAGRGGRPSYLRETLGLGDRDEAGFRVKLLGGIAALYLGGAVFGAFLQIEWHTWCIAVPLAVLVAVIAVDVARPLNPRA